MSVILPDIGLVLVGPIDLLFGPEFPLRAIMLALKTTLISSSVSFLDLHPVLGDQIEVEIDSLTGGKGNGYAAVPADGNGKEALPWTYP